MNPQPSKERPWQPTGTLWTLSHTLWTDKAKSEFDAFIAVAGGREIHTTTFCACPWLTVLRLLVLSGHFTTCIQVRVFGRKTKPKRDTELEIKEILERYKVCHIPNLKGLPLSVLSADRLTTPASCQHFRQLLPICMPPHAQRPYLIAFLQLLQAIPFIRPLRPLFSYAQEINY